MDLKRHLLDQAPAWRDQYGGLVQLSIGMTDMLLVTKVHEARQLLYGTATEDRPKLMPYHDEIRPEVWLGPAARADAWIMATRRITQSLVRNVGEDGGHHASKTMLAWLDANAEKQPWFEELMHHFAVANALESSWGLRLETAQQAEELKELQDLIELGRQMLLSYDISSEPTLPFPFLKWMMPWRTRALQVTAKQRFEQWRQCSQALGDKVRKMGRSAAWSQYELGSDDKKYVMSAEDLDFQGALLLVGTLDTVYHTSAVAVSCLAHLQQDQAAIRLELEELNARGEPLCRSAKLVAFLRETLRLYPFSAVGFPRKTNKDLPLPSGNGVIPIGTTIVPLTTTLGRDTDYWGEDANLHDYRRFMHDDGKALKTLPFPVFGFGYGRRVCPGFRLAETAMANAVGALLLAYELDFEPRTQDQKGSESKNPSLPTTSRDDTPSRETLDDALRIQLRGTMFLMDTPRCIYRRRTGQVDDLA